MTTPTTTEQPATPKPVRWHRHRWTPWGRVFSPGSDGMFAVLTGTGTGPWWQHRECLRCGKAQRRRVEVAA